MTMKQIILFVRPYLRLLTVKSFSTEHCSTANLYLHKVCPGVLALGALFLGRVDVLPGRGSAQHVVNLLQLCVRP